MTSREAARQHLKELKGKPLKQKLEHIITYYGFTIAVFAILLVFAVSYLIHVLTLKDTALNITCVGAVSVQEGVDQFAAGFAQYAGIDQDQYEVEISTNLSVLNEKVSGSYEAAEIMITLVATQSVDIVAADTESILDYFYQNIFADLTAVLNSEQKERYQDSFLYVDMAVVEQIKELINPEDKPEYPDPTKPDDMEQPVPVAIVLPENVKLVELCFPHSEEDIALGIAVNSRNLSNVLMFLDYITE